MKEADFKATGRLRLYSTEQSGRSELVSLPFRPNNRILGDDKNFIGEVSSTDQPSLQPGDEVLVSIRGVMLENQYKLIIGGAPWHVYGGPFKRIGEMSDVNIFEL